MIYVASPYSHPNAQVREQRYQDVLDFTHYLITKEDRVAFSPIVYAHEMANKHNMPKDAAWWEYFNYSFLDQCGSMIVLTLDGWKESVGVKAEIQYAEKLNIPISYEKWPLDG